MMTPTCPALTGGAFVWAGHLQPSLSRPLMQRTCQLTRVGVAPATILVNAKFGFSIVDEFSIVGHSRRNQEDPPTWYLPSTLNTEMAIRQNSSGFPLRGRC